MNKIYLRMNLVNGFQKDKLLVEGLMEGPINYLMFVIHGGYLLV